MDKRFIRRERSSEVEAAEESEEEFEVKVTQSKETMLGKGDTIKRDNVRHRQTQFDQITIFVSKMLSCPFTNTDNRCKHSFFF